MIKSFSILIFLILLVSSCSQKPSPSGLMVELLRAPHEAVITDSIPELSWVVPAEGISQIAYQVLVATSPDLLKKNTGDMWDSGKISTNKSINVSYNGKKLEPNNSYFWKVKIWGENDFESSFSEIQQFNTGSFNRDKSRFIGYSDWIKSPSDKWVAENRQIAKYHLLTPLSTEQTSDSSWFFDFGKAAFGTLEMEVTSTTNTELKIYLGERETENTVDKNPGTTNIGYFKTNIQLQQGKHKYTVTIPAHSAEYPHSQQLPPFYPEVLPFRFVEIIGKQVQINEVKQNALFYFFDDEASLFSCPDSNLSMVFDLCKYTLKATPFLGVYSDGNRERMPYEADAYIQQLGHYSVDREYSVAAYTLSFLLSHASWPTEWQMHAVMMAREHFMYTGDTELLEKHYDELKRKTLIDLADENGLISTRTGKVTSEFLKSINYSGNQFGDIVDWPPGTPEGQTPRGPFSNTPEGERDGYVFTDYNTVVNAFHYYSLQCMQEIARALGKTEDETFCQNRKAIVKASILKNMFDPERGIFVDGIGTDHASLHANMFPLALNIVPEENIKKVADYIKTRSMACSVYGAQYLLEALYNAGEADYALKMMTKEDKRSWMNMIRVGSTMTTEAWDEYFKPNLTWNHAWGSAPANIIPRRLMGIQPIDPGWKTFVVNPQPADLDNLEIKIPSIRGEINCQLKTAEKEWQMTLTVPGNTEAFVLLPAELPSITLNGQTHQADNVLHYLGMSRNLIRLKAGIHQISVKK